MEELETLWLGSHLDLAHASWSYLGCREMIDSDCLKWLPLRMRGSFVLL